MSPSPVFASLDLSRQYGIYTRECIFNALFLIAGTGILCQRGWARKLALVVLVLRMPYLAGAGAWAMAHGRPDSWIYYGVASLKVVAWNGVWFYLIYREPQQGKREGKMGTDVITDQGPGHKTRSGVS
jgi:hypothetical protein